MCEHCGQPLEVGRLRTKPDVKTLVQAKDTKRHCGFCRMNFSCCLQGLHGEVG